jgi:hypothetical protein
MKNGIQQANREMTEHGIVIHFRPDGSAGLSSWTEEPEELAWRFAKLVRSLVENPSGIRCAAGLHARQT